MNHEIQLIKDGINQYLSTIENLKIREACQYILDSNGKFLRPTLFLKTLKHFQLEINQYIDFAIAIEIVHSYSLIHDDLPCMDDDDYRRGKLSMHKKYDEGFAVLIGDTLLSDVFSILSKHQNQKEAIIAIQLLSSCIGSNGMILGQTLDLEYENKIPSQEEILTMYQLKTGKLLEYCLCLPACLTQNDENITKQLATLASKLGVIYQIKDDLDDYQTQDQKLHKATISQKKLATILKELQDDVKKTCHFLKITKESELYQYITEKF